MRRRLKLGAIEMIFALTRASAQSDDVIALPSCPSADELAEESPWEGSELISLDLEAGEGAGMALLSGPAARRRLNSLYGHERDGWLVGYVAPRSGAANAGVEVDDLIVQVNGLTPAAASDSPVSLDACSKLIMTVVRRRSTRERTPRSPVNELLRVPGDL